MNTAAASIAMLRRVRRILLHESVVLRDLLLRAMFDERVVILGKCIFLADACPYQFFRSGNLLWKNSVKISTITPMFRVFVFCLFGLLLTAAAGCQLNRSFTSMSPSQILGSQQSRHGIAALERGNLNEAEKRLEDAVKLNKNDINHRRHYAEVLWQQGKHQESLLQLNEAVKRGGQNNASLHISLAEKYLVIQQYTTAYRHADEAVQLDSQDARSWTLRGRAKRLQAVHQAGHAEYALEMFRQARGDYLRAVSLSPNDNGLLSELAAVQMGCGQYEQALATWQTVQNCYSQGGEPTEVLIGKTETLMALRRFDEAAMNLVSIRERGLDHSEAGRRLHEMMIAVQGNPMR